MNSLIEDKLKTREGMQDMLLNHTIPAFVPEACEGALTKDYGFVGLTVVPMAYINDLGKGLTEMTQISQNWSEVTGFSEEEIWETAFNNLNKKNPLIIDLRCCIAVTTQRQEFGAAAILTEKAQEELIREFGAGDYILQPSSKHEVILTKVDGTRMQLEEAAKMVQEINETVVSPRDRLADMAYEIRITEPRKLKVVAVARA